jgi:putative acetyltransferase
VNNNEITVERIFSATEELRTLIEELDAELSDIYPPEQQHGLSISDLFQPHIHFFLARVNGTAVGCAGVALYDSFAEVKRMYVQNTARGQGVADALLASLETDAQAAGLKMLRLETGKELAAAIRFYARCGFQPCNAFEPYASMSRQAIASSVFFEKQLSGP